MESMEDRPVLVFEIDDGATHWVAARSDTEAVEIYAEILCGSLSKYIDEVCDDAWPSVQTYTKEYLEVIVTDDVQVPEGFPNTTSIIAKIPRRSFKDLSVGLITTTEY